MSTLAVLTLAALATSAMPPSQIHVRAAAHDGEIIGDHVRWRSQYVFDETRAGETVEVDLAWPLPKDAMLASDASVETRTDESGRIVALAVESGRLDVRHRGRSMVRTLDITIDEPWQGDGRVTLHPPFAGEGLVQRVTLHSAEALRFEPASSIGAERRIGFTTGTNVERADRGRVDAWLEAAPGRMGDERMYLRADAALARAGGIVGKMTTAPAKRHGLGLAAAALFAGLLALFFGLYRRLTSAVELERAEAIIDADNRGLEL